MKTKHIEERREQIVNIIKQKGTLDTEEASRIFGVSSETIRQDFVFLEKKGILEKVYGGAKLSSADEIGPLITRQKENFLAKDHIVRKALEFLPDSDSIIGMDTGSTVALLASYLSRREHLLLVTNSHPVMHNMINSNNRLYALGGEYNKSEMSYCGEQAVHALEKLSLDICFLGTSGVLNRNGICSKDFEEIRIKQTYLKRSHRKIVLADSSKFTKASLVEVAPWGDVDILITDSGIPANAKKMLESVLTLVIAE
ncbi:MAG: DeoR/GlpR transcriptional regulator [Hespellia sp.]|nr:DeoR/GlpR transcriptional regulator [Hespellia sp.]